MWLTELSDEYKRAFLLAKAYETSRRKTQFGYKVFQDWNSKEILETPIFKTFVTVAKWVTDQHWKITWNESSWQGYIEFCFTKLAPTTPQPGQLKNIVLFKQYMVSLPDLETIIEPERSREDLKRIYSKVLRPDLLNLLDKFLPPES